MSEFDEALLRAQRYLARFGGKTLVHLIDGKSVASSGGTFDTLSPVDNTLLAKVARGGPAEIDQAAQAAKRAFATWRKVSGEKRREIMHKIADAIVARADEIAYVECMDTG